jgi:hypothetical protein
MRKFAAYVFMPVNVVTTALPPSKSILETIKFVASAKNEKTK